MTSKELTTQGQDVGKGLAISPQVIPTNWDGIKGLSQAFVKSGMFQDTQSEAQAIVKIIAGAELGLSAVFSMQNINMIRGRLTCSANTLAMLVKKSGIYDYRIKEHTDQSCTILFYQREADKWVEVGESTFTMKDAERAKLVKADGGWEKFPRAMLFSRAISQGARLYAPDAIGGVYTDEEIRSIPPAVDEPEPSPNRLNAKSSPVSHTVNGNLPSEVTAEDIRVAIEEASSPVTQSVNGNLPSEAGEGEKKPAIVDKDKPKRDPNTLKTIEQLAKALKDDFGLSYAEQWQELNITSWHDLSEPLAEAYLRIYEVRKA